MLSKKMAVSLTSLIAILLLAFSAAEEVQASAQGTFKVVVADKVSSGVSQVGATLPGSKYQISQFALPNLLNFFQDGGRLLVYSDSDVVVSEIMWGTDTSLKPHSLSQWIELKNVNGVPNPVIDIQFVPVNRQPNPLHPTAAAAGAILRDTVSTYDSVTGFWSLKGQGGRTGTAEKAEGVTTVVSPTALVSMQRVFTDATQTVAVTGTLEKAWRASVTPSLNFDQTAIGVRVGTPGASPIVPVVPIIEPLPPTPPPVVTRTATKDEIDVTEIMVDTSDDRFPQWIELTSNATEKVSLNGWEMVIDNAVDGDVIGGGNAITLKLDGVELDVSSHASNTGKGESVLLVAWTTGRHSPKFKRSDIIFDLSPQLKKNVRYQLLSYKGFRISLSPPQTGAIATFGDRVGNLDQDWELPMLEGRKRSSMIRREVSKLGAPLSGETAAGWILASATSLIRGPETYYGNDEDAGTPGYNAGGPLPVELSYFRPARDKQTGQVVVTWSTQSELNNAGFFIKRANQRHGEFKVINPTMIPGHGTTSERQMYTYTDTTAQPNVVYYYQIEDVSLDGNRQLLTRGIRLKGHIGAAGKATVIWGKLKTSHE